MPPVRRSKRLQPTPSAAKAARQIRRSGTKAQAHGLLEKPKAVRKKPSKRTYLDRSASDAASDPNHKSPLFRIPRELLYGITNYLPPAGLACLTLTCKLALETFGTDSWAQFRGRARLYHGPDASLCKLLQHDLPDHGYCIRCETVHPPLKPPYAHRCNKFTHSCFGYEATIDYWPQTEQGGYSIVWPHIQQTFEERSPDVVNSCPIGRFNGDFTIYAGSVDYQLRSSARWIDRSLILMQEYRLSNCTRAFLQAVDVLTLPLRICAHLTTATAPPKGQAERWRTAAKAVPNSPLLTHAIATAFPTHLRGTVAESSSFRNPAPTEETQMRTGEGDPDFIWWCRSCPTKFKVEYQAKHGGELVVDAWYYFGKELYRTVDYWKWFVRRDHESLGKAKRNSEFYAPTRSVPDFRVE
ncbi:hypothetical protein BJX63DRAFT_402319 [Aspergillus granulosus]|uniref:F-box domain-containing protein n=1 Tax=Aspergillus granulosus TaxID=176169 RepID=A0ABR4H4E3_9EURO